MRKRTSAGERTPSPGADLGPAGGAGGASGAGGAAWCRALRVDVAVRARYGAGMSARRKSQATTRPGTRNGAEPTKASDAGPEAEVRLAALFARYEPAVARLGGALRTKLRARLPGLSEVVYHYANQDALVIAYSPSGHGYEGVCSLALRPDAVALHFGQGARLSGADPAKLLQGRGRTVRHVVLRAAADLDRPEIEALVAAALRLANLRLDAGAKGALLFRTEAQKQRARRASNTARPAATRRPPKTRR